MTIPKKLYKYCPVGIYALRAISEAEVHHSKPIHFNDPLDCSPTIYADIDSDQLSEILSVMMAGEKEEEIQLQINISYWAAGGLEDKPANEEEFCKNLCSYILFRLHKELGNKGVLSLSTDWREPLMWSHYGDQHRGICIEYDTTEASFPNLKAVDYNASRSIRANDLYQWKVKGSEKARAAVNDTYFYAKAPQWKYENEWRDVVDASGVSYSNFDVTAVYLGIRCDRVWEKTLAKMLNRDREIKLFKVRPGDDKFELFADEVDRSRVEDEGIKPPKHKAARALWNANQSILSQMANLGDGLSIKDVVVENPQGGQVDMFVGSDVADALVGGDKESKESSDKMGRIFGLPPGTKIPDGRAGERG